MMKRFILSMVFAQGLALSPALAQEKESLESMLTRGQAELDSGAYDDAKATAEAALSREPSNPQALALLGRVQTLTGDYKTALETLDKAEKAGAKVKTDIGAAQYHSGDNAAALVTLEEAAKAEPEDADAQYFLGLARFKAEQYAAARESLGRAYRIDPDLEAPALLFSAAAAVKLGDNKAAEAELKQAIAADPDSDAGRAAKDALARLESGSSPFQFGVMLLNQYDSNVLLVPDNNGLFSEAEISNKAGNRGVLTLNGAWTPKFGQTWNGVLGYGLYQSAHWTNRKFLKVFDVTNHGFTVGADRRADNSVVSLPLSAGVSFLNVFDKNTRFSTNFALSPSYSKTWGKHTVGVADSIGYEDFAVDPIDVTIGSETIGQTRDNLFNQLHGFYRFAWSEGRGHITPGASLLIADATDDSSWDYSGLRLGAQTAIPFGKSWSLSGGLTLVSRSYANPFVVIADSGAPQAQDRSDDESAVNLGINFASGALRAVAGLSHTRNNSTVDTFTYRRTIFSLGLGAQF